MEELIRDYENFYSVKDLSQKYYIGQGQIRKILKENEVYIRTPQEDKIVKTNKGKTLKKIENKVINNYEEKRWGLLKSGREFGLTAAVVKKILKKYGIPIRDYYKSL